jgi:hypothetical protein
VIEVPKVVAVAPEGKKMEKAEKVVQKVEVPKKDEKKKKKKVPSLSSSESSEDEVVASKKDELVRQISASIGSYSLDDAYQSVGIATPKKQASLSPLSSKVVSKACSLSSSSSHSVHMSPSKPETQLLVPPIYEEKPLVTLPVAPEVKEGKKSVASKASVKLEESKAPSNGKKSAPPKK